MKLSQCKQAHMMLKYGSVNAYNQKHEGEQCPPEKLLTPDMLAAWLRALVPLPFRAWTTQRLSRMPPPSDYIPKWDGKEDCLRIGEQEWSPQHPPILWREEFAQILKLAWRKKPEAMNIVIEKGVREHYRLLQQYNSVLAAPVPLITLIGVWQSSAIQPDLSKETLCQERYEAPLFTESKARAPKAFEAARAFERDEEQEMNEHNLGVVRHAEEHYKTLPNFTTSLYPHSEIVPILPVEGLMRMGGSVLSRGPAAPASLRTLFSSLFLVKPSDRMKSLVSVSPTLRTLGDLVWPKTPILDKTGTPTGEMTRGYRRDKHLPLLMEACTMLRRLTIVHERLECYVVFPWHGPTESTKNEDTLQFLIDCLPGSEVGPEINTHTLAELGLRSSAEYLAYLRLSYIWDGVKMRNKIKGAYRDVYDTIPRTRRVKGVFYDEHGKPLLHRDKTPIKDWSNRLVRQKAWLPGREANTEQIEKLIPELSPLDLAHLGTAPPVDERGMTPLWVKTNAEKMRGILRKWRDEGRIHLIENDYGKDGGIRVRIVKKWVPETTLRTPLRKK